MFIGQSDKEPRVVEVPLLNKGPLRPLMEKTCPEKKGNLPSRVHFRKRLWSLSDCLGALTRLTQLRETKCL